MIEQTTSAPATPATADDAARRVQLDEAIILEHVSGRAWRVCDSRRRPGSTGRFLGFVEETNRSFEVMQHAETFVWTTLDTMRTAIAYIVTTNEMVVARRQAQG